MAVLSAGPLALSDPIGGFVPIPEAIRSDGLILKPDASLVPTDASFVSEASAIEQFYGVSGPTASNAGNTAQLIRPPLVAHTYSDFGSLRVEYVFAYSRNVNVPSAVSFSPQISDSPVAFIFTIILARQDGRSRRGRPLRGWWIARARTL